MGLANVGIRQELSNNAYRMRNHLWVPAQSAANALVQLSATSLAFEKAYFYGVASQAGMQPNPTGPATVNQGTVYAGEMDLNGNLFLVDPVDNDLENPVVYPATVGARYDFINFWVFIPTIGDRLLVKYC